MIHYSIWLFSEENFNVSIIIDNYFWQIASQSKLQSIMNHNDIYKTIYNIDYNTLVCRLHKTIMKITIKTSSKSHLSLNGKHNESYYDELVYQI